MRSVVLMAMSGQRSLYLRVHDKLVRVEQVSSMISSTGTTTYSLYLYSHQRRELVAKEGRRSALLLRLAHLARAAAREFEVRTRRAALTNQLREADGGGSVPGGEYRYSELVA